MTLKLSEEEQLASSVRLEVLRQIPERQRTPEETREFKTLERRRQRGIERGITSLVPSNVATVEEFWELNIKTLTKKQRADYAAREQRVLDIAHWLNFGWNANVNDPETFVSLEEGLADLDAFIAENGTIRNEPQVCHHPTLRGFAPGWALTIIEDRGSIPAFYKDGRLPLLCQENEVTKAWCLYGFQISLFSYNVRMFKCRVVDHERSKIIGDWQQHVDYEGNRCWRCQFEKVQKAEATNPKALEINTGGAIGTEEKQQCS